ncbi:L-alanine-DL-glutamate epimerase-like enolase superfamily enzyme [Rhodoligotrophos appendicifer]|uniref:mandelate racemase/muconate lactonizing enzyme family protein n=1 Tax=Rhodoligotrophos appendicifer TaxID=987056 RepID=UPI001187268D|nr:mandelate racemase/muconate lactonizing enzyme family protein [Rhodoligotrophos appendicifer]
MRIAQVHTRIVSVPLPRPVITPIHNITAVDNVLVELETDEGVTGIAYLWCFGLHKARALEALVHDLARLVKGMDPFARERINAHLWRETNFMGRAGAAMFAISAIDTALWDIAGKALGVPVWRLLGGEDRPVPAYAGGLFLSDPIDVIVKEAEDYKAAGFGAIKMRCGGKDWRDDIARVEAVRAAVGPDLTLMVDVVQGWTVERAIKLGRALEPYDLYYIEDPIAFDDIEGMAQIAAALDTPIAAGENDYGRIGFRRLIEHKAIDIPMIDLQRVGGISEWMKVAALAGAWQLRVVPHVFYEMSLHVMAATPSAPFLEYVSWWEVLFKGLPTLEGGAFRPTAAPGLGLSFDNDAIEPLVVR